MINKSLITNLVSIFIVFIGYFYKDEHSFIFMTGVFALSGSVTNWIAVHMLFEKIPFLYERTFIIIKRKPYVELEEYQPYSDKYLLHVPYSMSTVQRPTDTVSG